MILSCSQERAHLLLYFADALFQFARGLIKFRLHFGQMVISPPNPTKPPHVCNVALSQVLNERLVKGFKHKLPESALISADIEKQKRAASEASAQ